VSEQPVLRRCAACRGLFNREQLWRVIRLAGGGLALDQGMGRSAYLCRQRACLNEARRRKRLQRALRCLVPDSILETLDRRLGDTQEGPSEAR
jgi:predicted RNA-binding protein YlxR (DUF448 family)